MKCFWKFVETAIDAAVPFVAMGIFYAVFISPDWFDPTFVLACSLFVAFHVMYPAHHRDIGGANRPE